MYHHPVENEASGKRRKATAPKRRRTFGVREILLVIIAFTLLALLPTTAQFGAQTPVELKDGLGAMERPEENFAGSAFYFLDDSDTACWPTCKSTTWQLAYPRQPLLLGPPNHSCSNPAPQIMRARSNA
jgi:hypothetical protein